MLKEAEVVYDMLIDALMKGGVQNKEIRRAFVESIEASFTKYVGVAVEEERERCQKTVALFVELCLSDLQSAEAEALREKMEELADMHRINDNPLHEPISLGMRKLEKEIAALREKVAAVKDDDPEMDATDWAHPAWWRGNERGVEQAANIALNLLHGMRHTGVYGGAELEQMVKEIVALRDERAQWRIACGQLLGQDDCEQCPHGGRTLSCPKCCIERVREAEREACAVLAEIWEKGMNERRITAKGAEGIWCDGSKEAAHTIAIAIRKRGDGDQEEAL